MTLEPISSCNTERTIYTSHSVGAGNRKWWVTAVATRGNLHHQRSSNNAERHQPLVPIKKILRQWNISPQDSPITLERTRKINSKQTLKLDKKWLYCREDVVALAKLKSDHQNSLKSNFHHLNWLQLKILNYVSLYHWWY